MKRRHDVDWKALERATLLGRGVLEAMVDALLGPVPQILLCGPAAVGKTTIARALGRAIVAQSTCADAVVTVHAHPGLGYEYFVEGIRPRIANRHQLYDRVDGVFLEASAAVRADGQRRVIVVDDLHTIDVPSAFGELVALLDRRDAVGGEYRVDLRYTRGFTLPPELSVIATVLPPTDATQTTATWRRRFAYFEITPTVEVLDRWYRADEHRNQVPDLVDGFDRLNTTVAAALGPAHLVGHGMFMATDMTPARLRSIWDRHIAPIIAPATERYPILAASLDPEVLWPSLAAA
jgi:hypothetical protein